MLAGVSGEVAVPGDELAAFAVAADPFQFAASAQSAGTSVAGASLMAALGDCGEQALDGCEVWFAIFERGGASDRSGRRSGSMCQAATAVRSKSAASSCGFDVAIEHAPVFTAAKCAAMGRGRRRSTVR